MGAMVLDQCGRGFGASAWFRMWWLPQLELQGFASGAEVIGSSTSKYSMVGVVRTSQFCNGAVEMQLGDWSIGSKFAWSWCLQWFSLYGGYGCCVYNGAEELWCWSGEYVAVFRRQQRRWISVFRMDFGALWNNLSIGKLVRSIRLLQILVMHLYMYL